MRKFISFVIVSIIFVFTISFNSKANSNENYNKIIFDDVSTQLKNTGSTTNLYEVTVTFSSAYDLIDGVMIYFKHNVNYNTLRTPLNRGYNSYNILSLNKIGITKWELVYELAISRGMLDYYNYDIYYIAFELIDIYIFNDIKLTPFDYLREYYYRIVPDNRPNNLYEVGMEYETEEYYGGHTIWKVLDYLDISEHISDYNLFLSYTVVDKANLYKLYFYDNNKQIVATVLFSDFEEYLYKFEHENRYVVSMLDFVDSNTKEYINYDNVKFMRFEYIMEPFSHNDVLINLIRFTDISIGEYWRIAEGFNKYFRAGYDLGLEVGIERGQDLMSEEFSRLLEEEYNKGYNKGINDNLNIFSYLEALFGEQGLGRLLAIEPLPGVTIGAVIMIPIMFFLVGFIWRWFS